MEESIEKIDCQLDKIQNLMASLEINDNEDTNEVMFNYDSDDSSSQEENPNYVLDRSLHKNSLAPETASFPGETIGPRQMKINAVKDVPVTYSVQFIPNQTFDAQNVGSKQNKFDGLIDGLTYKRKGRKDGNFQREKESDKVVLEDKADKTQNIQTETLKTKLWELLGTISSPKSLGSIVIAAEKRVYTWRFT